MKYLLPVFVFLLCLSTANAQEQDSASIALEYRVYPPPGHDFRSEGDTVRTRIVLHSPYERVSEIKFTIDLDRLGILSTWTDVGASFDSVTVDYYSEENQAEIYLTMSNPDRALQGSSSDILNFDFIVLHVDMTRYLDLLIHDITASGPEGKVKMQKEGRIGIEVLLTETEEDPGSNNTDLVVHASANIFGAGKSVPPAPAGHGGGILPTQVAIAFSGGTVFTFPSVSGQVACCNEQSALNGPDGGSFGGYHADINSFGGISGIVHENRLMFLVGVFIDNSVPGDPAPARRNVTNDNNVQVIAPSLSQTFFIGDGRTSSGQLQSFIAPPGATRLFLGFADSCDEGIPGCYQENHGELQVKVQTTTTSNPSAFITGPASPVSKNENIIVTASANDPNNQIVKIQFFVDAFPDQNWIGTDFDEDGDNIYRQSWDPNEAPPITEGYHFATLRALGVNESLLYQTLQGEEFYFQVVDGGSSRTVRVVDAVGSKGGTVRVPIVLSAQGNENALGFSLDFDEQVLSSPVVSLGQHASGAFLNVNDTEASAGRLGIALALPIGGTFPAGDRELVVVDFHVLSNIVVESTQIHFIDQPVPREISDASANALSASWLQGTVRFAQGYECDVAPRNDGNERVTVVDWVQAGLFAAGIDNINQGGNEFQRADSAPREGSSGLLLGDGKVTITDWVQCGLYAAGLDPLTQAGGPVSPSVGKVSLASSNTYEEARKIDSHLHQQRIARLSKKKADRGEEVTMVVELDAEGDENALGFSISFESAYLTYKAAVLGDSVAQGAVLNVNALKADSGRVGFAMALPTGTAFNAGTQKILNISFDAFTSDVVDSTAVVFTDDPIVREVSDVSASVLEVAYEDGWVKYEKRVGIAGVPLPTTEGFQLMQNFPNPFNSTTSIEYTVPTTGHVTMSVFNLLGQEIETLVDGYQLPGTYTVRWSSSGHESGIYFYQLKAENYSATRKFTLLR